MNVPRASSPEKYIFTRNGYLILTMIAALVASTGFVQPSTMISTSTLSLAVPAASYVAFTNILYLARRSYLRDMTKRQLWKIRTTRETGVSFQLYIITILTWQAFVAIFPLVELVAKMFGHVSFFYSYPNASGLGIILEPRNIQHLKQSKRAKQQIRFDWHRFNFNIGDRGRDGYRHPPSIERNLPHIDMPQRGLKHWPWRRRKLSPK